MIYLPAIVSVTLYFEKRRSLATGLSMCGSGIGTIIFPPLVEILVAEYGWKGAALIVAGLVLNCCIFGSLLRPLKKQQQRKRITDWSEGASDNYPAPVFGAHLLSQNSSALHSPPHTPADELKHEGATVRRHRNECMYILVLAPSTYTHISNTPLYIIMIGYTVVTDTNVTMIRG